jgi:hypothetical protein
VKVRVAPLFFWVGESRKSQNPKGKEKKCLTNHTTLTKKEGKVAMEKKE